MPFAIALSLTLLAASIVSEPPHAAPTKPVLVFILAGQSNMLGEGAVDTEAKGTLAAMFNDPAKAPLVKHLKNEKGEWVVREDVWARLQLEDGRLKVGPLGFGFTGYGDQHHFGPELQFGHVVGDHFDNQVLLIKTAWGGKSLYEDFRPPSSGGKVGPYYTKMLEEVRTALANLPKEFPDYANRGYELAGFVWWQGWNDGCTNGAVPEYERNLVNFINDVRKDLNAPKLPFVIGELTGPWVDAPDEWGQLRKAQAAAAARSEFAGNVLFVPTHDFVRKAEDSPCPTHAHHEFANGETYFLVGDALGKGMLKLVTAPASTPH
ncbi:MAG: sialate O-acetylesterase [Phycisphaerales bacterium]